MSASRSKWKLDWNRWKRLLPIVGAVTVLVILLFYPLKLLNAPAILPQTEKQSPSTVTSEGEHTSSAPQQGAVSKPPAARVETVRPSETAHAEDAKSNQMRTLASLKKVDDYPLYTMTYYGGYDLLASESKAISHIVRTDVPWACSLFIAFGDAGHAIYGRNFDWDFSPAILLFTHPPNGYASVSMVDISYLGFSNNEVASLSTTDKRLLDAPFLPFDGMNEYGLTVGMAAVNGSKERPPDPRRPTVGSLGIIRVMLDRAKNTDEAVSLLQNHNIDFTGGPPLHYLIADPSGHSVTVEFIDGTMQVTQNDTPWQVATNFFIAGASDAAKAQDSRYATASKWLQQTQGRISPEEAMGLLKQINQDITQWSIVYDMGSGDVTVSMARKYETVHKFHLALVYALRQ